MNLREFKEWLENFPEDAEVEVVTQDDPREFPSYTKFADDAENFEYLTFGEVKLLILGYIA